MGSVTENDNVGQSEETSSPQTTDLADEATETILKEIPPSQIIEETEEPQADSAIEKDDSTNDEGKSMDSSMIDELIKKNDSGDLTQDELFRAFIMSAHSSLSQSQKIADIEKRLEDAEARLEKVEVVVDDNASNADTEVIDENPEEPKIDSAEVDEPETAGDETVNENDTEAVATEEPSEEANNSEEAEKVN